MSIFLAACQGERVETIPVWFMRQAGRSLPGYRKLREQYGVLELAHTPELAAHISLEPVELLGVDAAILFADIMLLPMAMGVGVEIVENVGPVVAEPIRTPEDIARLETCTPEKIAYLLETIRILRTELKVPLIGFSGAPFTLASYLIEGKPTRDWLRTKRFMLEQPEAWENLMQKLSDGIIVYLCAQIDAGAQAVQLFDSWVGCLPPAQYRAHVLPHMQRMFAALKEKRVPRIHFGTSVAGMLEDFANVDCDVIGVDWRIELAKARAVVGTKALQGNLDPATLLAPWPVIKKAVDELLATIDPKTGYVFNLGHGMPAEADDVIIKKLVDYVHSK